MAPEKESRDLYRHGIISQKEELFRELNVYNVSLLGKYAFKKMSACLNSSAPLPDRTERCCTK